MLQRSFEPPEPPYPPVRDFTPEKAGAEADGETWTPGKGGKEAEEEEEEEEEAEEEEEEEEETDGLARPIHVAAGKGGKEEEEEEEEGLERPIQQPHYPPVRDFTLEKAGAEAEEEEEDDDDDGLYDEERRMAAEEDGTLDAEDAEEGKDGKSEEEEAMYPPQRRRLPSAPSPIPPPPRLPRVSSAPSPTPPPPELLLQPPRERPGQERDLTPEVCEGLATSGVVDRERSAMEGLAMPLEVPEKDVTPEVPEKDVTPETPHASPEKVEGGEGEREDDDGLYDEERRIAADEAEVEGTHDTKDVPLKGTHDILDDLFLQSLHPTLTKAVPFEAAAEGGGGPLQ
ncbi:hypothetical protein T484DRAFT_1785496, partial [Baffinella frigidus]